MSCQFAEMMEMHRKQQLVAKKKSAQGALSFDSPHLAKSRKLKSSFTLTRSAADIIGATQADEISNATFLASQSSRTTARIRLQEKYVKVATMYKDECSPEEIKERISEIAFNAMVKLQYLRTSIPQTDHIEGSKKLCTVCLQFISA
jgi:hypothetical protein